jgi:hypothetical protein
VAFQGTLLGFGTGYDGITLGSAVVLMPRSQPVRSYVRAWDFPRPDEDPWMALHACGEDIELSGRFHEQVHIHIDATGRYHWVNHWHAQGKAADADGGGNQYVLKGRDVGPTYASPETAYGDTGVDDGHILLCEEGMACTSTDTRRMELIGKGKAPNYRVQCQTYTTVDANGEMVTHLEGCAIPCQDE